MISDRLRHDEKADFSIVVTVEGMEIFVMDSQLRNAADPMLVNPSGRMTLVRLMHDANVLDGSSLMPAGISTLVMDEQF